MDNTVETFLLKSEGDYIGLDQGKDPHQLKSREENMRQLLDVTNSLTSEELRDFEMRYVFCIEILKFSVIFFFIINVGNRISEIR